MQQLKGSLQPALHMDLIDHSHSSGESIEILRVNYDVTALDVFILKPSIQRCSTKNVMERRTVEAVKRDREDMRSNPLRAKN